MLKRVENNEVLLVKNSIYVDSVKNNNEYIYKLLYQKPNEKILGIPVRLHIYNSARENIDSILSQKYNSPNHPKDGLKNLLSVKQYNSYVLSKQKLNAWLKRSGEKPVVFQNIEAERSSKLLQKYFYTKGWFDNKVNYSVTENNSTLQVLLSWKPPFLIACTYKVKFLDLYKDKASKWKKNMTHKLYSSITGLQFFL